MEKPSLSFCAVVLATVVFALFGHATSLYSLALLLATLTLASQPAPPPLYLNFLLTATSLYDLILILIPVIPANTLRLLLHAVDPSFRNAPPGADSRTDDCSLSPTNLLEALDVYVLAHIIGYGTKAAILRDRASVWASAVAFEAAEFVLLRAAPRIFAQLAECWWDRFALDLLVSNVIGMEVGLVIAGGAVPSSSGRIRLRAVAMAGVVTAFIDSCHFCLAAALRLEKLSPLLSCRMALLTALGAEAGRQFRLGLQHEKPHMASTTHQHALIVTVAIEGTVCAVLLTRAALS